MSFPVDSNTPAGGETPVTSTQTPVAATPATPAQATPATPPVANPQPTATPGGEAQVPSYRLRQQRDQYEQRIATMQAEAQAKYDQIQKQLHSIVGVTPPANPEIDQIKQQFGQLFPGLSKMEDKVAQLEALLARSGDLETQTQHYWTTYGRQTMDRLFTRAEETLGGPLSDAGKEQLHASFTGYVQANPERSERYASDPTIVDDFWKAFSSSLIDPVRRTAAAQVSDRIGQNLPQDSPGGAPRATPAPQPANLDERMNLAWQQYNKFGQK